MGEYRLKLILMKKKLTQKELAKKTGINEALISLAIRGKYILDSFQMVKIAEALNMPVNEIFDVVEVISDLIENNQISAGC